MEIQAEVEGAVKAVEQESEKVIAKTVEALNEAKHVTSVAVEKVEAAVEKVVEKVLQELTADEKLAIREIENGYLKTQMEINRLSQITQKAQKDFTDKVEFLTKKYAVDPATWIFDNVELIFRKK